MTLEEAKKILEEEGFKLGGPGKPGVISEAFAEYESPEICEAMQIVCSAGFQLAMLAGDFDERKERLKKEYGKNHIKGDFSGNKSIEHCGEPVPGEEQPKENSLKAATDAFILQANEIMRLKKKNAELLEAIDKMKEGNPALEESASQFNEALLDEQAKEIKRLGKEISKLNGIIHKKNLKIEELEKESFRHLSGKVKMFGENVDLEQMLKDKNAVLADVAEELRLSKIREKNLAELGLKYVVENEDLKEKLADKGGNGIDWKRNADAIKLYVNRASRERLWNPISQDICNEKELSFIINHGGKRVKYALRFDGTDIVYECSDPDKKPRIPTPEEPKHGNSREDFIKKTIESFNIRAANLGCVGNKDGNGIFDQMIGVDNAEEGGDNSGVIVLCGKDFIDAIKKMK